MKKILAFIGIILFFINCKTVENKNSPSKLNNVKQESNIDAEKWYLKNLERDSIPGISYSKWVTEQKNVKKSTSIIVAVIDTQLDINHLDLKNDIWINSKEIPNNNIDDDRNGYTDDVNGWNFTGFKNGTYVVWGNFEFVRYIRKWNEKFENKKKEEILDADLLNYNEYLRAVKSYEQQNKFYKNYQKSMQYSIDIYQLSKDTLKYYFPKENYTIKQLDSMYNIYKVNDKTYKQRRDNNDKDFGALIAEMKSNIELNTNSFESIKENKAQLDSILIKNLNINYNERKSLDANSEILDKGYGNNNVCSTIEGFRSIMAHSTKVSGIITTFNKTRSISNKIKIMPLSISFSGDEHDKDIAMAIRYAVDNGAKVINMSFGKQFSLYQEWVTEALKYAEEKNVLIIHASGNDGIDIDSNRMYPSDYNYQNKKEVCKNFINVGSTTKRIDSTLVSDFSNYGKQNVDLFAPGEEIYTTIPSNKYDYDSGTSLAAPMVSGTAALIWLYYPKLTAAQVKQIILDSGTPYDIEVLIPGGQGKKTKFSELSKSGKVLNVYNAMKMAEAMSKKNKN